VQRRTGHQSLVATKTVVRRAKTTQNRLTTDKHTDRVTAREHKQEHKSKVMTDIYVHYITMHIKQYAYAKNQEMKKQNKTKKNCQN